MKSLASALSCRACAAELERSIGVNAVSGSDVAFVAVWRRAQDAFAGQLVSQVDYGISIARWRWQDLQQTAEADRAFVVAGESFTVHKSLPCRRCTFESPALILPDD